MNGENMICQILQKASGISENFSPFLSGRCANTLCLIANKIISLVGATLALKSALDHTNTQYASAY